MTNIYRKNIQDTGEENKFSFLHDFGNCNVYKIWSILAKFLYILVPPPPPRNVRPSQVKETFIYLEWEHPDLYQYFSIRSYYIKYRKSGKNTWLNKSYSADLATKMQLNNLESNAIYVIKVVAKNDYSFGKESEEIEVKTLKEQGDLFIFKSP